jgi:hypothetical protein
MTPGYPYAPSGAQALPAASSTGTDPAHALRRSKQVWWGQIGLDCSLYLLTGLVGLFSNIGGKGVGSAFLIIVALSYFMLGLGPSIVALSCYSRPSAAWRGLALFGSWVRGLGAVRTLVVVPLAVASIGVGSALGLALEVLGYPDVPWTIPGQPLLTVAVLVHAALTLAFELAFVRHAGRAAALFRSPANLARVAT